MINTIIKCLIYHQITQKQSLRLILFIASAIREAIETSFTLWQASTREDSSIVSVIAIWVRGGILYLEMASRKHTMGYIGRLSLLHPVALKSICGITKRSCSIYYIITNNTFFAFYIAYDIHHLRLSCRSCLSTMAKSTSSFLAMDALPSTYNIWKL